MLLPHLAGVAIEKVEEVGGVVYVRPGGGGGLRALWVRRGQGAQRYGRYLADAPVGGRRLVIRLRVRRWFCDEPSCGVSTFVEQAAGVTVRHWRRTPLLRAMLGVARSRWRGGPVRDWPRRRMRRQAGPLCCGCSRCYRIPRR
ncbi:hypothetical protein [Nocardia sputorum]|uniref:hypothetical protein n=1 Tax=Nocardia sputorum TaxID=2984338 RepID=UPI002490B03D|nr:hypothetical protein [Nocardia sputorum]